MISNRRQQAGTEGTKLYSLELGRFLAALLVFICHLAVFINLRAADPAKQLFHGKLLAGPLGVQYFFVLSGFVMGHAHYADFGKPGAVLKFWWRRACRIYPAYWLALAIPLYYLYHTTPAAVVAHLALLDPGFFGSAYNQEYIQAAWTLRYEIAFYMVFGLCLLPYVGKPILACWVALSLWRWSGLLIRVFHPPFMMEFYTFTLKHSAKFFSVYEHYFFAGLAAAFIFQRVNLSRRVSTIVLAVSLVSCVAMLPGEDWGRGFGTPAFTVPFALAVAGMILGLAALERHGVIRLGRYAGWAGAMSYPLYVFHEPVMIVAGREFPWGKSYLHGLYAHFAAMICVTLLAAALVAFLFDRPLQRGLRRLTAYMGSRWGRMMSALLAARRPMLAAPAQPAGAARQKLYSLELGRFIAALLVVLCHAGLYLGDHAAGTAHAIFGGIVFPGQLGVQYFFVLSGFVMASAHHRDFGNIAAIPRFWWRRICRIYPAYWLALCIPFSIFYASLTPGSAALIALLDPWHGKELIPAAWSLRYEVAFYIMFGLCMLPYIGRPLLAYWMVLTYWRWNWEQLPVLAIHTPLLLGPNLFAQTHGYKFVDVFELYFFAGLAVGYAYVKCRPGWRVSAGLLAAGTLLFCYLLPREGWGTQYGNGTFIVALSYALGAVILGLAGLERAGVFRLGRVAGWLGMMSYPLYVVHMPIALLADKVLHWGMFSTAGLYVHFVLLIAVSLIASVLVTFLFDQPVQRGLRRIWRKPGAAAPPRAPLYSSNPGH